MRKGRLENAYANAPQHLKQKVKSNTLGKTSFIEITVVCKNRLRLRRRSRILILRSGSGSGSGKFEAPVDPWSSVYSNIKREIVALNYVCLWINRPIPARIRTSPARTRPLPVRTRPPPVRLVFRSYSPFATRGYAAFISRWDCMSIKSYVMHS